MPQLKEGAAAPKFDLQDQNGKRWTNADLSGKHAVLYFYPKDDTPGCTVEACEFRDDYSSLKKAGALVFGVSADSAERHQKFADKFSLPFPLLADTEKKAIEAFGAWGERSMYGRKFMGIVRSTVLVGPDGKVQKVWPKVKAKGHAAEVLAVIRGEEAAGPAPKKKAPAKKR